MGEIVPFSLMPTNLKEAMDFSTMVAQSSLCPPQFRGKAGDVLICIQYGAELGLNPMQALQSISVINNRACIWGDGALAVVQSCPAYENHREWYEGSLADETMVAYCAVTRKGSPEYVKSFSVADAKKAGLWAKPGVWQQYPARMLQMRARAFAIRDQFSDALKGLQIKEEVEDYNVKTKIAMTPEPVKSLKECLDEIESAKTEDELKAVFMRAYQIHVNNPPALLSLISMKDKCKERFKSSDYVAIELTPAELIDGA